MDKQSKERQGTGIAVGIALGVALGAAMDNIGLGIALGLAIGAGFDFFPHQKKKNDDVYEDAEE